MTNTTYYSLVLFFPRAFCDLSPFLAKRTVATTMIDQHRFTFIYILATVLCLHEERLGLTHSLASGHSGRKIDLFSTPPHPFLGFAIYPQQFIRSHDAASHCFSLGAGVGDLPLEGYSVCSHRHAQSKTTACVF